MDITAGMIKPFHFYSQKILPLVYDDSLSYYEVLCKTVDKLNEVIGNENKLTIDMQNLYNAFDEYRTEINTKFDEFTATIEEKVEALETFMNEYFDNLDITEEVNAVLNRYVADGTFSRLIEDIIAEETYPAFVDSVAQMTNTKRVYILSTTGEMYYYNGTAWINSGIVYGTGAGTLASYNHLITSANHTSLGIDDIDTLTKNRVYAISGSTSAYLANMPDYRFNAVLFDFGFSEASETGRIQLWSNSENSFIRIKWGNTWSKWRNVELSSEIHITKANASNYAVRTLRPNSVYGVDGNVTAEDLTDLPHYGSPGVLVKLNMDSDWTSNYNAELLLYYTDNKLYMQLHWGSLYYPWTNQFSVYPDVIFDKGKFADFDNAYDGYTMFNVNFNTADILHAPPGAGAGALFSSQQSLAGFQMYYENAKTTQGAGGRIYYRYKWAGEWGAWFNQKTCNGYNASNDTVVSSFGFGNDADAFTQDCIVAVNSTVTPTGIANLPAYGKTGIFIVTTYAMEGNLGFVQYFISDNQFWFRTKYFTNLTTWQKLGDQRGNYWGNAGVIYGNDLNDYTTNGMYALNATITSDKLANLPRYGVTGVLIVRNYMEGTNAGVVQMFITSQREFFWRVRYYNTWYSWQCDFDDGKGYFISTCVDKPLGINSTSNILILGDSITKGYNLPTNEAWPVIMCNKIGCAFNNIAVSGARFNEEFELSIKAQYESVNNWNRTHVFIAAGVNDASTETDINLFKQYVQNTINFIKDKNSNIKIIFITPIRSRNNAPKTLVYSSIISNIALQNDCSVISGYDCPVPTAGTEYYDDMTLDGTHPNTIGQKIYARFVLNAVM